jgi:intraflagellar transport protein 122
VQLATKEGILLNPVSTRTNWAWAVAARARNNFLACGGEDGSITVQQIAFSTVHGLYHERYAYRDMITDVIIQHLLTEQKVRIKCR